jgi:hypothetical protein
MLQLQDQKLEGSVDDAGMCRQPVRVVNGDSYSTVTYLFKFSHPTATL